MRCPSPSNAPPPSDRIISIRVGKARIGVPHRILWWHEIANFDGGVEPAAVTLCPLTGSSLSFRRKVIDGAEFGVSGLLFKNNLVMYDRRENESLWPQMSRAAGRGPREGMQLPPVDRAYVAWWYAWASFHPETDLYFCVEDCPDRSV